MSKNNKLSPETLAVQSRGLTDDITGALVPPIHLSTTFTRDQDYGVRNGRSYIRDHGPTQEHAEQLICELEGGEEALSFSSGMSACTAPFYALKNGEKVAVSKTVYFGLLNWLSIFASERGIAVIYFDPGNEESLKFALKDNDVSLVWLETPANPTWIVTDIKRAADISHEVGAMLAIDSTAATPVLTRPLELGADIVCHSATKFLNGHSDILGGILIGNKVNSQLWNRIRQYRIYAGPILGSFEAFLLIRGLRTLFLRVSRQCENAMKLAEFLDQHRCVSQVCYPGLTHFPGHEVAQRQMSGGFGGMLSFMVMGSREEAINVVKRAKLFKQATSLGGVESLIEHRKSSENDLTSTPENLIRVSVGIERYEDLECDLNSMLKT